MKCIVISMMASVLLAFIICEAIGKKGLMRGGQCDDKDRA